MSNKGFGFSGFKLSGNKSSSQSSTSNNKYPVQTSSSKQYYGSSTFSRIHKTEEDYFDDDEELDSKKKQKDSEYQPAPGSPGNNNNEDDEEDELDAFMAGIEKTAKKDLENIGKKTKPEAKGLREDIEAEDDQESYFKWLEENPNAGLSHVENDDEDKELEYDGDGNIIVPEKSKIIDPLPPIDHSTIEYESFEKNFYNEHDDIKALSNAQVDDLRKALGIKVSGYDPPKPVSSFGHFGFDEQLMRIIRKSEFTQPTPIQAQAIPVILSGRDVIGIAKTGSGKTAAFLWPALVHIMDQKEIQPGDGPIAIILAPTRELAQQIHSEAKKFCKAYNIASACAYGGGSLYEQTLACQEGIELLVCTPGRLIDLIKKKGTNLQRVTYLVLDEADRMFDMGFEPQVRSIANHVRPNRQTLLFSATFKKKIEKLAREILSDPIRIIQGELGEANENITQKVLVFSEGPDKWAWVNSKLVEFTSLGKVLVFVTQKTNAAEFEKNLVENGFKACLLHGDMHQDDRTKVINEFKKTDMPILVATDVAARGLDIPAIKTVINYDVARDIDTHTHRIGRTGRAGEKGVAYTLVTAKDKEFCPLLVRNLESADQEVPQSLLDLAMQLPWFKNQRSKQNSNRGSGNKGGSGGSSSGGGTKSGTGGGGGAVRYKERPGFGFKSNDTSKTTTTSIQAKPTSYTPDNKRYSTIKEAYSAQFKSHFQSASSETAFKTSSSVAVPNAATYKKKNSDDSDDKNKKKSRWDS